MEVRSLKLFAIAVSVPLIGSWVIIQTQFWLGANVADGILAFFLPSIGVVSLSKVRYPNKVFKVLAVSTYLFLTLVAIWLIVLITSCANGDCL